MARVNFQIEKRRKEVEKKKKQELKLQRKLDKKNAQAEQAPEPPGVE